MQIQSMQLEVMLWLPFLICLDLLCESQQPLPKRPRGRPPKDTKNSSLKTRCLQTKQTKKRVPMYILEDEPSSQLADAVGDSSLAASLDPEVVESLLEAVQICAEQHSSRVDSACTFDLEIDPEEPSRESVECESNPENTAEQATLPEPAIQTNQQSSGSSSSHQRPQPSKQETEMISSTGAVLQVTQYKKPAFGNLLCEVRRKHSGSSITTAVGRVTLMVSQSHPSYKAHCAVHKYCQCWVSGIGSDKLDKLVDWLAAAPDCDAAMHTNLSKELRQSFGMKVSRT